MTRRFKIKNRFTLRNLKKKNTTEIPIVFDTDFDIHKTYLVYRTESLRKVFMFVQYNVQRIKKDKNISLYFLLFANGNYILLSPYETVENIVKTYDLDQFNIKVCIENTFG